MRTCFPKHSAWPSHVPICGVTVALVLLSFFAFSGSIAVAQTTSTWTGGAGNWAPCPAGGGNALWDTCSTNVYPDGNFNAVINGGPVTLAAGNGISIDNLTLGSGQGLIITPGYLDITATSIANSGSVSIGAGNGLTIEGTTTVTLSGSGTLTINDPTARISGANGSPTFVNQQTIQGQGSLGLGTMAITNNGTINANTSGGTLTVQPSTAGIVNTGTMEASSGSTLEIIYGSPGPFSNTGGTVEALNGGTVILSAGTYTGGTLTTAGTGTFTTPAGGSNPMLNNLTNAGAFKVPAGASMTLEGTITNGGTLTVPGELFIGNAVTLKGSGTVVMQNGTLTQLSSASLANQQLIHGYGTLSVVPITNTATISADSTGKTLTLSQEAITNSSIIEATGGGTLTIASNTTVANTGAGTIEALAGSTINFGGTVSGGTITTSGSGTIQSQNGILDGTTSTPTNAGKLDASAFDLFMQGTVNNTGTIALSSHACLILNKPTTLTGNGKITMTSTNCIFGSGNSFTNQGTIQGAGTIGDSNPMPITNTGTILANSTSTLFIVPDVTGFTNTGKLTVNKGCTLTINGLFNNVSGGVLTSGTYNVMGVLGWQGAVTTNDANITLTGASAELLNTLTSTNALSGLTSNTSTGSLSSQSGQTLKTTTNLSNAGKVTVGTSSSLAVGGTYTQTSGTLTVDGSVTATSLSLQKGSLVGKGTVGGSVTSTASVTAGDSSTKPGKLTLTGTFTQNSGGTLNIYVGGSAAGSFGNLAVSNGVTLGGTLSIKDVNGFVPAIGNSFTIVTGSVVSGQFATVKGTSINSSEHYQLNYNSNNVTLTVVSGP